MLKEDNIITIDVGNSSTVFGVFSQKGELLQKHRVNSDSSEISDKINNLEKNLIQKLGADIIVSSVVPELDKIFPEKTFFVNHQTNLGIGIKTDNPSEVGADRLVNCVAAKCLGLTPAIVIDFGTATTLDVLDKNCNYAGGVISAGLRLSLGSLSRNASKLPQIEFTKPNKALGKNTKDAMLSGCYYGYIGLIEKICHQLQQELGYNCKLIATGGFANSFKNNVKNLKLVDENLTLKGLYEIWKINKNEF